MTRLLVFSVLIAGPVGQCLAGPAAAHEQYYRLQLKNRGHYLDADHCSDDVALNPGSDFADGLVNYGGSFPPLVDGAVCS